MSSLRINWQVITFNSGRRGGHEDYVIRNQCIYASKEGVRRQQKKHYTLAIHQFIYYIIISSSWFHLLTFDVTFRILCSLVWRMLVSFKHVSQMDLRYGREWAEWLMIPWSARSLGSFKYSVCMLSTKGNAVRPLEGVLPTDPRQYQSFVSTLFCLLFVLHKYLIHVHVLFICSHTPSQTSWTPSKLWQSAVTSSLLHSSYASICMCLHGLAKDYFSYVFRNGCWHVSHDIYRKIMLIESQNHVSTPVWHKVLCFHQSDNQSRRRGATRMMSGTFSPKKAILFVVRSKVEPRSCLRRPRPHPYQHWLHHLPASSHLRQQSTTTQSTIPYIYTFTNVSYLLDVKSSLKSPRFNLRSQRRKHRLYWFSASAGHSTLRSTTITT